MSKTFEMAFQLGAKMKGNFGGTFRSAGGHISQLNSAISELSAASKKIEAFRDIEKQIKKTSTAIDDNADKIKRLNAIVKKSKKPSAVILDQLAKERTRRIELKKTQASQRASLSGMNREMREAGIDTARLVSEQNRLSKALEKTTNKQKALKSTMLAQKKNSQSREGYGNRLQQALGVGAAIAAPLGLAAGSAISFESAMADVKKVVNFDTPDGLVKLTETIRSMPRKTGLPLMQAELAAIAAAGGQLGVAATKLPIFIQTVGKMSTAFDMSAEDSGNAAAKLSNVYGIPIEKISELGDAVNHLSDNTAAKAPEMVQALLRVGGTAKQFGLSAENTAALADAFISLGKPPEVAGTAINAMLNKLNTADRQSKKFTEGLDALGLTAGDLKDSIGKDAQGALLDFLKQVEKLDKQDQAGVMADMFGLEYSDDISLLVGSLDKYEHALGLVANKSKYAGSMQREFLARSATTENNLKILGSTVNELGINLGTVMLPAINAGARALAWITGAAADFAAEHPVITKIGAAIAGVTLAVTVGAVAVSAAGYAYTVLKGGLIAAKTAYLGLALGQRVAALGTGIMTAAQWALNGAMAANPIGLVVAGVAALSVLAFTVTKLWQPITAMFSGIWDGFLIGFSPVISAFKELFSALSPVWDFFSGLFKPMQVSGEALKKWAGIGKMVGKVLGGITTAFLFPFIIATKVISKTIGVIGKVASWFKGNSDNPNIPDTSDALGFSGISEIPPHGSFGDLAQKTEGVSNSVNNNQTVAVQFSPNITIPPGADAMAVRRQVDESMQAASVDLEDKMKGVMAQEARLSFAN